MMIRVTGSLVHKSGAEILRHDSRPFARAGLRTALEEALAFLCDEGGYTVEEGGAAVVLRIERVIGAGEAAPPRLVSSRAET
jgi:hypothetical protein